jgi:hypothetical protein
VNPVQIIATLRKLGNYLVGLFPALLALSDWVAKQVEKAASHPSVSPHLERLLRVPTIGAIWKVIRRFYWRDYSKDRLDLTESPPECLALLRPVFQLCALLVVAIPFTQFAVGPVAIETMGGYQGIAPGWSVVLWCICLPIAWSALVAGAGLSNRIAYAVAAIGCLYYLASCTLSFPRSYWNALVGIGVIATYAMCERNRRSENNIDWKAILTGITIGVPSGIQLVAMTPLREFAVSLMPKEFASITAGAVIGVVLSMVAYAWARLPADQKKPFGFRGQPVSPAVLVWAQWVLFLTYCASAVARGGLAQTGGLVLSSLSLSNPFLWPAWYFVGVGIVFKLMGSSRVISNAASTTISPRLLQPALIALLVFCTMVAFADRIVGYLILQQGALAEQAQNFWYFFYQLGREPIWSNPNNAATVHWLSWVLLFDVCVVTILFMLKRLTNAAVTRLAYITCLAALLIWEYLFQLGSFARSGMHSVLALFLFAAWLLWLMHTVGWSISVRSSPMWPAVGRFAMYSGITLFCLLEIHARTAARDFRVANEVFLSMFRGVIDFGLPYFLYLYTSSRFPQLPVKLSTLFGVYICGALMSLALNAGDKLAVAGWSIERLNSLVNALVESVSSTGRVSLDMLVPDNWLVMRAVIYCAALVLVAVATAKRLRGSQMLSAANLFLLVAFASGVVSFSTSYVDLPLPNYVRVLTAPMTQQLLFNADVFLAYLAYWIPALILVIAQFPPKVNLGVKLTGGAVLAMVAHYLIFAGYQIHEFWLRATGALQTGLVFALALFALLVAFATHTLSPQTTGEEHVNDQLMPYEGVCTLLIMSMVLFAGVGFMQVNSLTIATVDVAPISRTLSVPTRWQLVPAPPSNDPEAATVFRAQEKDGSLSLIAVGKVKSHRDGVMALAKQLTQKAVASGSFPNLELVSVETWTRRSGRPGATAFYFQYDMPKGNAMVPMIGLSVLVPSSSDFTEYYTLYTNPSDFETNQWHLAQMVKSARTRE